MQIKKFLIVPEDELLKRLKTVRLRGFGQPKIYEGATLEIYSEADPSALIPAQKYVLKESVNKIISLYNVFSAKGIDIFSLREGLVFWTDEMSLSDHGIPLLPPIVEESLEPGGKILLINDGMHRIAGARKIKSRINVVLATNVPPEYPYYAYPLERGWDEVEEVSEVPEVKKNYRIPDNYKSLFRDFNAVFEGVQKERKRISV